MSAATPNLDALLDAEQRNRLRDQVLMALADQSGVSDFAGDLGWISAEHVHGSGWVERPKLAIAHHLTAEMLEELAVDPEQPVARKHDGIRWLYQYSVTS